MKWHNTSDHEYTAVCGHLYLFVEFNGETSYNWCVTRHHHDPFGRPRLAEGNDSTHERARHEATKAVVKILGEMLQDLAAT